MNRMLRRVRAACAASALFAAAACSDASPITAPSPPREVPGQVAAVSCRAELRRAQVSCDDAALGGGRGDRVIGGQRVNVLVASSNVSYDSVTHAFGFDVTVQNLLPLRMGSDGVTVSGVYVFFASGPNATSGSGTVGVQNADGLNTFTGSLQPYFFYAGGLGPQQVSPARHWVLDAPPSVQTFSFTLYISTPLVPAIVFENLGGLHDIYRMGIDGNDTLRLSTSALTDANPTVAAGTVVFTSYRAGNAELYSVPLKGGTETRLTTTTGTAETTPALSPDGTQLAWAQGPSGGVTKIYHGTAAAAGAAPVDASNPDAIQSSPSWRNSTELAFTMAAASSADIYRAELGGTAKLLTGTSQAEVEPAWSPDGTRVAFASNRTGDTELYLLEESTGVVTRLTTRTGSDGAPTWLPDGRIVFTCVTGVQFRLCLVDPASPATITVLTTPGQADHASAVRY